MSEFKSVTPKELPRKFNPESICEGQHINKARARSGFMRLRSFALTSAIRLKIRFTKFRKGAGIETETFDPTILNADKGYEAFLKKKNTRFPSFFKPVFANTAVPSVRASYNRLINL